MSELLFATKEAALGWLENYRGEVQRQSTGHREQPRILAACERLIEGLTRMDPNRWSPATFGLADDCEGRIIFAIKIHVVDLGGAHWFEDVYVFPRFLIGRL